MPTPKECLQNMTNRNGEYFFSKPTKVAKRKEIPTPPMGTDRPPTACHRSVAYMKPQKDQDVSFNLTSFEQTFINDCAKRWNLSYEQAVERVIHDGIRLLKKTLEIAGNYSNTKYR